MSRNDLRRYGVVLKAWAAAHRIQTEVRDIVNVIAVANSIGLAANDRGEITGTIDEEIVLGALSTLAAAHPGNDELFAEAALRVDLARSAGVEQRDANSVFNRSAAPRTVQLRYRSEMAELFTDLAIDIGLLTAGSLADSTA